LLGEQDRIVGISGYVVRPPQARGEKPRVSAFTSANVEKILALRPDLVLTFSDLQANIVANLIRRGLNVHAFNRRSVAGIFDDPDGRRNGGCEGTSPAACRYA
jgi:iron complex transport system substrate-binding protein